MQSLQRSVVFGVSVSLLSVTTYRKLAASNCMKNRNLIMVISDQNHGIKFPLRVK